MSVYCWWHFHRFCLLDGSHIRSSHCYAGQLAEFYDIVHIHLDGLVAEWLECWTQAQKGLGSNCSLRQTIHTHHASVHQAAKLVAALLRVARVTAGLAESNGSLPPGLWLTSPAGWLPKTRISSGTLHSAVEYGLPLPFFTYTYHSRYCGPVCVSVARCGELLKMGWTAKQQPEMFISDCVA